MRGYRWLAGVTAIAGWAALALQAWLLVRMMGMGEGLWRFLGYFTILTNIGVAAVASGIALGQRSAWTGARAQLVVAAAIIFVGAVYWALLAGTWQPEGWQLVADVGLHTVQPILFALLWWQMREGRLDRSDAAVAMAWPLGYSAYAMVRGAGDGWYAYWFLDPSQQGWGGTLASLAGLSLVFFLMAWAMAALDRRSKQII